MAGGSRSADASRLTTCRNDSHKITVQKQSHTPSQNSSTPPQNFTPHPNINRIVTRKITNSQNKITKRKILINCIPTV
jgi:hypothetical protein